MSRIATPIFLRPPLRLVSRALSKDKAGPGEVSHPMDSGETLSLEDLSLSKTRAKRDYTQRRANRRKGRERLKLQSVKANRSDKTDSSHAASSTAGANALPFATLYQSPPYTAVDVPPLGSRLPYPPHTEGGQASSAGVLNPPLGSDSKQSARSKRSGQSYPWLSKPKARVSNSGLALNQPSANVVAPTHHLLLAPSFTPVNHRSTASVSGLSVPGARIDKKAKAVTAALLPAACQPPAPRIQSLPVPTPAASYLAQASRSPIPLSHPQHLLLVLDLNGTLLARKKASKTFQPRLSLKSFLDYCFANHSLLIWSSASPQNVQGVCSALFTPAQRARLLGEWGRDTLGLTPAQYCEHVQVYKRLSTVWADEGLQARHPGAMAGKRWDQSNTVLIDDSVEKAMGEPLNMVQVPEFVKEGRNEIGDVLGQVVGWLEEARGWSDISGFCGGMRRVFRVDGGWGWDWKRQATREGARVGRESSGACPSGNNKSGYQNLGDDNSDDEDGGVRV